MRAMRILYPEGVSTAQQHRDVILTYAKGWGDALQNSGSLIALEVFKSELQPMLVPGWMPDNSWCWWI